MTQPADTLRHPRLHRFIERAGHPAFLLGALALWWAMGLSEAAALVASAIILLLMEWLERVVPAKPRWRLDARRKLALVGVYVAILVVSGLVLASYAVLISPALAGVRGAFGGAVWPSGWPLLVQVLMLYFAADFIYYWIHRAIHRFGWFWRLSGHGVHHAFGSSPPATSIGGTTRRCSNTATPTTPAMPSSGTDCSAPTAMATSSRPASVRTSPRSGRWS